MNKMHKNAEMTKNTERLMAIADRMYKRGFSASDFCERLAKFMGEAGNDDPSDEAIDVAKEWEKNPELMWAEKEIKMTREEALKRVKEK